MFSLWKTKNDSLQIAHSYPLSSLKGINKSPSSSLNDTLWSFIKCSRNILTSIWDCKHILQLKDDVSTLWNRTELYLVITLLISSQVWIPVCCLKNLMSANVSLQQKHWYLFLCHLKGHKLEFFRSSTVFDFRAFSRFHLSRFCLGFSVPVLASPKTDNAALIWLRLGILWATGSRL